MNLKELKEIFRLVEKTDFTEVEINRDNWKIKISRGNQASQGPSVVFAQPNISESVGGASVTTKAGPSAKTDSSSQEEDKGTYITSPFVGTFYRAPSPESDNYAEQNQDVKKGQILCIVEAMKLMNEIEAEVSGKITHVYPDDGQPVEFGEKLFRIE